VVCRRASVTAKARDARRNARALKSSLDQSRRIYARINHDSSRELLFVSPAAERSPAPLSHAYTVRVSNPPVPSFVAFVVPFSHPPREQASRQGGAGAILFPFPAPSCPAGVLILEFEELSLPVENV